MPFEVCGDTDFWAGWSCGALASDDRSCRFSICDQLVRCGARQLSDTVTPAALSLGVFIFVVPRQPIRNSRTPTTGYRYLPGPSLLASSSSMHRDGPPAMFASTFP